MRTIALAMLALGMLSANAYAQEESTYALASTGLTFGNASAVAVGAELGTNVGEHIQIYATAGHHRDVLPTSFKEPLDVLADAGITMRAPAFLFSSGVRYLIPTNSGVRPYVSAGGGTARLKLRASVEGLGDVTNQLVDAGYLSKDDVSFTKLLIEFGGGVAVPLGSALQLDLGYKYIKIMGEERFGVSRLMIGFGADF
jgi:Outer membrane protein beta-barrel domain